MCKLEITRKSGGYRFKKVRRKTPEVDHCRRKNSNTIRMGTLAIIRYAMLRTTRMRTHNAAHAHANIKRKDSTRKRRKYQNLDSARRSLAGEKG